MKDMSRVRDLTGKRFSFVQVLHIAETNTRKTFWTCQCDCGTIFNARSDQLLEGRTKSCGCYHLKNFDGNRYNRTHNESGSTLYIRWQSMRGRCNDEKDASYGRYGARGITVCEEWNNSYEAFSKWARENGYAPNLSIDRIDNGGNYEPNNCRWADMKTQCRNRRSNIMVNLNGKRMTLIEACETTGARYGTVYYRYKKGWPIEKAIGQVAENELKKGF